MSTTIGVDIGYETVKVIGLEKQGKGFRLKGMNIASIPAGSWQAEALANQEAITQAILDALKLAKPSPISGKKAVVALPESSIFSATFTVPQLPPKELAQALPYEIADKLSVNLDDYYYDYETVNSACHPSDGTAPPVAPKPGKQPAEEKEKKNTEDTGPQLTVFAVAAKKTLVGSLLELFQKLDLELIGIDIKPGAIARAVIPQQDTKVRAIIDLGVATTGASIVEGHNLRVTSTIPWGAKELLDQENEPASLRKKLNPVFDELVHIIKFFENRVCPGTRVEEVILSGSGASLQSITDVFQQETGLVTKLGEPFASIDAHHYPVPEDLSHTFADAVGLAMRGER